MKHERRFLSRPPTLALGALVLTLLAFDGGSSELPAPECPGGGGRIAVGALGPGPQARVSSLAARSPYFLLFEAGAGPLTAVTNEFADVEKGAGTGAAYLLSDLEVDCLIAGRVGDRMQRVLAAEGIDFVSAAGLATEAAAGRPRPRRGPAS